MRLIFFVWNVITKSNLELIYTRKYWRESVNTTKEIPKGYLGVLDKGYVGLVNVMGGDIDVANAARVSYDKESTLDRDGGLNVKDENLIKFLWNNDHTSPFRHCAMTFEVYAPLMVARQHWKYVVSSSHIDDQAGWNESSRRYITEEASFYVPASFRSAPENSKQGSGDDFVPFTNEFWREKLINHIDLSERYYQDALDSGMCAEQARLFLPAYGMYVRYRWTTSLHGVLNFLNQRLEHDAQKEIQEYALAVKKLAKSRFPATFKVVFPS